MEENSVDSIVTDPPYGLSFMGKKWDYSVPSVAIFEQCLRVLKPGGHLLAFAGTRTQHRMAVNIEDAGFEIRDMIAWVYGSGFPKSHNIAKAIDKAADVAPRTVGIGKSGANAGYQNLGPSGIKGGEYEITAPATPEAQQWEGWGTALKPALEPITVARKPFKGTVAKNVLEYGTGGINIGGGRIGNDIVGWGGGKAAGGGDTWNESTCGLRKAGEARPVEGRFPANLIHDGSEEVTELFPHTTSGARKAGTYKVAAGQGRFGEYGAGEMPEIESSKGSAARFFYCAKASKKDRDDGLEGFEEKKAGAMSSKEYREDRPTNHPLRKNTHPTVKPTDLMRYLVRLVTPPGGIVLDPFMGSGSTGKACKREGLGFIGCELDPDFVKIARARIEGA